MKIALALHGLFDSVQDATSKGKDGYEHIKKHILDKGDVDVFVHSWDKDKASEIIDLYNPKKCIFEDQIDFNTQVPKGLEIPNPPRQPSVIFSHFYSVSVAVGMACRYQPYDIVIKSRFDLGRINRNTSGPHNSDNPYPVQCINFNKDLDMNKLHMANWQYLESDGPADMWFYSSPQNMIHFESLYGYALEAFRDQKYIESLDNINDLPNAIKLYKRFFEKNGLWDKKNLLETKYE